MKFKGFADVAERLLTVSVLACPARIEVGLKEQVAGLQLSEMFPVNVLGAEAATLNVVEVVPMRSTLDRVLAERVKIGMPIPVNVTEGLFAASDWIARPPERFPLAVGVNVMEMVQA